MDKFLKIAFGTEIPEEIVAKKKAMQNVNKAQMSGKKPEPAGLSSTECKTLCTKAGVHYKEGYEERCFKYRITDETVDRYGDIVRVDGLDVENYRKNPVLQHAHENTFPIGNCIKIWKEGEGENGEQNKSWNVIALFMDKEDDPSLRSETCYRMVKAGMMPACSIGFLPKEQYYPTSEERAAWGMPSHGMEYKKSELLELSTCSVPANPNALQNAIKTKAFGKDDLDILVKNKMFTSEVRTAIETAFKEIEAVKPEPQELTIDEISNLMDEVTEILTTDIEKAIMPLMTEIKALNESITKQMEAIATLQKTLSQRPEGSPSGEEVKEQEEKAAKLAELCRQSANKAKGEK